MCVHKPGRNLVHACKVRCYQVGFFFTGVSFASSSSSLGSPLTTFLLGSTTVLTATAEGLRVISNFGFLGLCFLGLRFVGVSTRCLAKSRVRQLLGSCITFWGINRLRNFVVIVAVSNPIFIIHFTVVPLLGHLFSERRLPGGLV